MNIESAADDSAGREYGDRTALGRLKQHPHRRHPELGRLTVVGQIIDGSGEWTVKDDDGVYWSLTEAELLSCPPAH